MADVQISDTKERWRLQCRHGCRWQECRCIDKCEACGHIRGDHASDELGHTENCERCACEAFRGPGEE